MESVTEIWKPVKGYEGRYEVSNMGRVRSLARIVVCRDGRRLPCGGKILESNVTSTKGPGYPVVNLEATTKYVHQLVLEAFVGPCPPGMEACHDPDPCRSNNCLSNLRWDTPASNQGDRAKHGTSNRGERCGTSRLTETQVREILASPDRGCDLARQFGVTQQAICDIRKGRNWSHLRPARS